MLLLQVLYSQDEYVTDPILAAVGQLQFEVRLGGGGGRCGATMMQGLFENHGATASVYDVQPVLQPVWYLKIWLQQTGMFGTAWEACTAWDRLALPPVLQVVDTSWCGQHPGPLGRFDLCDGRNIIWHRLYCCLYCRL